MSQCALLALAHLNTTSAEMKAHAGRFRRAIAHAVVKQLAHFRNTSAGTHAQLHESARVVQALAHLHATIAETLAQVDEPVRTLLAKH